MSVINKEVQVKIVHDAKRSNVPKPNSTEMIEGLLSSTPARIGVWRSGTRPLTKEMLKFRIDHAAAVDSVYSEVSPQLLQQFSLVQVETKYENKENYLKRPDMGRILTDESAEVLRRQCLHGAQVQIVVSDGLSANAIEHNLAIVYPNLIVNLNKLGLSAGTPIFVKGGRVAIMDQIGDILKPDVLVLLIGERPGLKSSSSMSAYMGYQPRSGMLESDRNVISNIHQYGTTPEEGAVQIAEMLKKMLEQKTSGVHLVL